MATHRCVTECFHNSHRFEVGELATFQPGDEVPEHFEPVDAGDDEDDGENEPKPEAGASGKGGKQKGAGK